MAFIQAPELARRLQRKFDTDGPGPTHTLAPEIVPVVLVEDLTPALPEDTGFIRQCVGTVYQAGVAAEYAHAQLFNPDGSGSILHAEMAVVSIGAADTVNVAFYDTRLGNDGSVYFRDRRLAGSPVGAVTNDSGGAELGTNIAPIESPGDEAITIPLDIILAPGQGLVLNVGVNNALNASFWWTERAGLEGEA